MDLHFRYVYELVIFVDRHMARRPEAVRAACEAVLRRKLVATDALRHVYRSAAADPELREELDELRRLQFAARLLHYAALRVSLLELLGETTRRVFDALERITDLGSQALRSFSEPHGFQATMDLVERRQRRAPRCACDGVHWPS